MSGVAGPLYRAASWAATPFAGPFLDHRIRRAKEDPHRVRERLGFASAPRPGGKLLWVHAASVGEATSVLPLLDALHRARPGTTLLLTTGTLASARLIADRRPVGVLHQYAPLDVPPAVGRFLDHWRPNGALWVEQELWPNMLGEIRARGLPAALINGRMSTRSAARWSRAPGLARTMLGGFQVVLGRSETDALRLRALGAIGARCVGDLKDAAPPLPCDEAELAALRTHLAGAPVWLAASTHPGEEDLVATAHGQVATRLPGVCTIIVPRHPERGPAIAAALCCPGLNLARRSAGAAPGPGIYLADTLGELGLFYRLAQVAFVGGSLVPHGGQNPLEPARLGCPVLLGPHTANVAPAAERLIAGGAAERVAAADLGAVVVRLLTDPAERARRGAAGRSVAAAGSGAIDGVLAALAPVLERLG